MMKKTGVSKPVLGASSSSSSSRFSKRKSSSKKRSKTSRSSKPSPSITPDTQSEASETDFVGLLDPPVKSRFSAANFLKASRIIRSIKNPHLQFEERPVFSSDEERILTYELIVAILKYSSFLREALEKSSFYLRNPELQNVGQEELLVLLYDLIEREFRVSPEDPDLPDAFAELQTAIMDSKTKLMAHIAKLRIKHEASTLENLLPNNLRHQHNIDKNPLYFWINLKKVQMPKIVAALKASSLQETRFEDDTLIQESLFSVSHLHPDLIRMHSSKANTITSMPMFRDGYIVVQDKSACLPPYVLAKALYFKEAVYHRGAGMENLNPFPDGESDIVAPEERYSSTSEIAEEWYHNILEGPGKNFSKPESVVVTHCGLGRSAAHLAILLAEAVPRYLSRSVNMSTIGTDLVKAIKSKFVYRPPLNVVVFGTPVNKHEEISKYIKKTLGVANIRLYSEDFINVHHKDSRIRGCGAILVNPPSSGSALKDPVTYICSEGGDEQVLTQFSEFVSSSTKDDNGNKVAYSPNQAKYLNHALSIPNVKLVMYTTCSNLACENTEVVRVCLNEARRKEETKKCKFYASMVVQSQSKMYKDVTFEIVNMNRLMEGYGDTCFQNNFVDMHPSSACSGVFMSLIRRRDRQINMAKNPVKQFVASHMQVKSSRTLSEWGEGDDDQLLSSGVPSLTNFSSVSSLTEEELANYLIHKLNLDVTNEHAELLESTSPSVPVFLANMKKKTSKKAIVKRVSIPTHSSLLRQKEKYLMNASYPSSGSQTPRTGRIASAVGIVGERPDSSRPSTTLSVGSSLGCPNHIHQHGHTCVCARHAKKFPDLVKHI